MPRDGYKPEQSSVSLWPNDRKQRDTDPDLTGTAQILDEETGAVTEYWANAWENEPGGNRPVISIKLKRKDAAAPRQQQQRSAPGKRYGTRQRPSNMETWERTHGNGGRQQQRQTDDLPDDDIPF